MEIGMIGLGKMGASMVQRLIKGGHEVVVFDLNEKAVAATVEQGAVAAESLEDLVQKLPIPRIVWMMLPAGKVTEDALQMLGSLLESKDLVVDGGNSNYKDTQHRADAFSRKGIYLVDVGTSGGVWGLTEGYSLMVGGEAFAVDSIKPLLETLAPSPQQGWGHVGPVGAGHYVKMVHNGIEYGLMQAYAEGFQILETKPDLDLDLRQIAKIWRHGSVIRSWLLDLISDAIADDPKLKNIQPWVADSGEGRWTVFEAVDLDVPAPVITMALQTRLFSRQENNYAARLLAVMRQSFGGHTVKKT